MKKFKLNILLSILVLPFLTSCQFDLYSYEDNVEYIEYHQTNNDEYVNNGKLDFINTSDDNEMDLSLDNKSLLYQEIEYYINEKKDNIIDSEYVNIEEMLNYFDYDYTPTNDGINITSEVSTCPWNTNNLLETISIYAPLTGQRLQSNITFLVDTYASMSSGNRLELFQEALKEVLPYFDENDKISIVTYGLGTKTILNGESIKNKDKIIDAIDSIKTYGISYGNSGLNKAYNVSKKNFIKDRNNHIFIVSDGNNNDGISKENNLENQIKNCIDKDINISVLGVSINSYYSTNSIFETIKEKGNGYFYNLTSLKDVTKALKQTLYGGMKVIAKDAKAKVSFNKEYVSSYRIIGYDNKLINSKHSNNDNNIFDEIYEGYQLMIAFELVPTNKEENESMSSINVEYKDYKTLEEKECNANATYSSSNNHQFASLVCEFGLILRDSEYKGNSSLDNILNRSKEIQEYIDNDESKKEFIQLVKQYKSNCLKEENKII